MSFQDVEEVTELRPRQIIAGSDDISEDDDQNVQNTDITMNLQSLQPNQQWKLLFPFIGVIICFADNTMVSLNHARISSEFGHLKDSQWLLTAWLLVFAVCQPIATRLSDLEDRSYRVYVLLVSYVVFLIGLAICQASVANNFWMLVVGRGIAGVGGASIAFLVSVILNDHFQGGDRAAWQVANQVMNFIGLFVAAVPYGKLINQRPSGWQTVFLLEIPLVIAVFGLVALLPYKPYSTPRMAFGDIARSVDLPSAVYLGTPILTFALALSWHQEFSIWANLRTWCLLIVSVFFTWLFYKRLATRRAQGQPSFIPRAAFTSTIIHVIIAIYLFNIIIGEGFLYLLNFYTHASHVKVPEFSGWLILSWGGGKILGAFVFWALLRLFRPSWFILVLSNMLLLILMAMPASVLAFAASSSRNLTGNKWIAPAWSTTFGIPLGMIESFFIVAIVACVPLENRASTYAIAHIAGNLGNVATVSIVSLIFFVTTSSILRINLQEMNPEEVSRITRQCMRSFDCLENYNEHTQAIIRNSFLQAVGVCLCVLTVVAALLWLIPVFAQHKGLPLHMEHESVAEPEARRELLEGQRSE